MPLKIGRLLTQCIRGGANTSTRKRKGEKVDRYSLEGKGLVAVVNLFVDIPNALNPRPGTIKDEDAVVEVFSEEPLGSHYVLYGYDVTDSQCYKNEHNRDLDNKAMNEYLDELKEHLKNNEYSSFILFIFSHGSKKGVAPYHTPGKQEDEIPVEDIMKRFEEVLPNKPKVIVIQACKGNEHNKTVQIDNLGQSGAVDEVQTDTIHRPSPPKGADMLVAYSTINGYVSLRYKETGSVYIQSLVNHIRENNQADGSKDLIDILTKVHADVSQGKHDVTDEGIGRIRDVRQMPYYQSSFCRRFCLLPSADGYS